MTPNPWFGKKYSQDLEFVALGGENGRTILTTPEGKQICVARYAPQNVVRFGFVEGTNCRIGAWGPQAISLNSDNAKLVHVKKPGKWMVINEAEQKRLINPETMLLTNESSPSFNPGGPTGNYWFRDNVTWFSKLENGQWKEADSRDKNQIQVYVTDIVDGVTPNPWFGKAYTDKMTLIKFGTEKGREILTTPEGKKVCGAYFKDKNVVRFGFVDGNDCRIGAWGPQAISLNSDFARLVHVKDGGTWMSVNDAQNKGYVSADNMMIKGLSSPAYEPGKNATGGYYFQQNALWFARNESGKWYERNFMDKNIIQVFVPGVGGPGGTMDAPNSWFGKKYSQDLEFVALGAENGRTILTTPEGKQICVARYAPQNVVRFGFVEGTNCRIGAWGPQAISLNSDNAKLVHVKKPGKWMVINEAEQKRLINPETMLLTNESSPSFNPGGPTGNYWFRDNVTWFSKLENGQWKEADSRDKNQIQVYVTDIVDGAAPNPWFGKTYTDKMTLIKLGTEKGREILTTPEGKKVCAAHFARTKVVRFGFVDGNDCRIGAWGPQAISLNSDFARLVHVKDGGTWMSVNDAQNKGYVSADNMMIKGLSSPAFEPGKNATGGYYLQHNGLWFARNEGGTWHERSFMDKNIIQVFVPGVGETSLKRPREDSSADAPANKKQREESDAPNPLFGVSFQHVDFVRPGAEKGRAILTAPDTQNQVCVVAYNLGTLKGPGDAQMPFGYTLDVNGKKSCRIEAWGIHDYAFDDHPENVFLVHAKTQGSWKPIKEMQANDWNEMIIAKAGGSSTFNNGIASFNGIPGKTHLKHHNYYGGSGDVNNKGKIIENQEKVLIYMPTQAPAAVGAPSSVTETPNPWFGKAYTDKMTLIKLGTENGREILTNPDGKQVCAAYYKHSDGQDVVRFGFVDSTVCRVSYAGPKEISLNSDFARLVHVKDGGAWMSVTDATNKGYVSADNMMVKNASSPAFEPGKNATGGYYLQHNGLWFARNEGGTWHERSFMDKNIIQVFVPGVGETSLKRPREDSSADAPANKKQREESDAPNPLFGVSFQHVDFVRPGAEKGRAILTAPDTQNQVCVVAYNLGTLKGPGDAQMPFGYTLDVNGKKSCRIEAWGIHDYAFDDHPENVFLVHAKTQGSWKPIKEMQANDWNEMIIAKAGGSSTFNNGIASFNGIPGKTHLQHHNYYGGSGDANNKAPITGNHENVRIYMPTQAPTAVGAPSSSPTETASVIATMPVAEKGPTIDPSVTQTAQGPTTEDQVLTAVSEGRVIVEDPEVARLLESQPPISLDGESFKWVDFGKGFALQPVSLSPISGVICRLFGPNNQAYIGNVYKNNRTTTSDIALSEIKVGQFVCRAGTDLQGNKVHITSKFQTLGNRGENILWAPITSIQPPMWETGYKAINAGADVTEEDKTFKASGICRIRKTSDATNFHIGRAVVDQNNTPHCYLKAKGVETDITGEPLQSVEVLIRPGLAQEPVPVFAQQPVQQGSAALDPAVSRQAPTVFGMPQGAAAPAVQTAPQPVTG